jgi:hypothetical protein
MTKPSEVARYEFLIFPELVLTRPITGLRVKEV